MVKIALPEQSSARLEELGRLWFGRHEHIVLPIDGASLFCGQGEHESFPAVDLYLPTGQTVEIQGFGEGIICIAAETDNSTSYNIDIVYYICTCAGTII